MLWRRIERIDGQTRVAVKALGFSLVICTALVGALGWFSATADLRAARAELEELRQRSRLQQAAIKFFTLQSTLGVADFGGAPSGIREESPSIRGLARRLGTIERAFEFVAGDVEYTRRTTSPETDAVQVLARRLGNCQGKANLMASLLLDLGGDPETTKVVYGSVILKDMPSNHAWVECVLDGRTWVIDTTDFLPAGPGIYDHAEFYNANSAVPVVIYDADQLAFGSL